MKILSATQLVGASPEINYESGWESQEEAYIQKVVDYAREHGSGAYAGKEAAFPFADGYARYIVLSLKPAAMIHLPVGDAWQLPYANRLTAKDVQQTVDRNEALDRIFNQHAQKVA